MELVGGLRLLQTPLMARDFAVAVCGFPRSGSSMTMRMLDRGGVPPVPGADDTSYELHNLQAVNELPSPDLVGHAVKLLDSALWIPLRDDIEWRFIWLERDRREQARSQIKFLKGIGGLVWPDAERRLMATYKYDEPQAVDELRSRGKLHRMTYKGTLANPRLAADRLAKFVEEPFDAAAAAAVVESRTERCAPDLSFEIGEDP